MAAKEESGKRLLTVKFRWLGPDGFKENYLCYTGSYQTQRDHLGAIEAFVLTEKNKKGERKKLSLTKIKIHAANFMPA